MYTYLEIDPETPDNPQYGGALPVEVLSSVEHRYVRSLDENTNTKTNTFHIPALLYPQPPTDPLQQLQHLLQPGSLG